MDEDDQDDHGEYAHDQNVDTGMIKMMMRRGWTIDNYWAEEPGGGTVANNLITTCCWRAGSFLHTFPPSITSSNSRE